MVGERYNYLLALAKTHGIERWKITEQALTIEAGKVSTRNDVPDIAGLPECGGELAELSRSASENHGQTYDFWLELGNEFHSVGDVITGIKRDDFCGVVGY